MMTTVLDEKNKNILRLILPRVWISNSEHYDDESEIAEINFFETNTVLIIPSRRSHSHTYIMKLFSISRYNINKVIFRLKLKLEERRRLGFGR